MAGAAPPIPDGREVHIRPKQNGFCLYKLYPNEMRTIFGFLFHKTQTKRILRKNSGMFNHYRMVSLENINLSSAFTTTCFQYLDCRSRDIRVMENFRRFKCSLCPSLVKKSSWHNWLCGRQSDDFNRCCRSECDRPA